MYFKNVDHKWQFTYKIKKSRNIVAIRDTYFFDNFKIFFVTGKSLSEALIFASTNPQYDKRLFIELRVQYMKIPSSENKENKLCTEIVFDIQNNLCTQYVPPCSAKRRASEKDLPVWIQQ